MSSTQTKVPIPTREIAFHPWTHLDEAVAAWLLQNYGPELFPGASDARFVFWRNGKTPDGQPAKEWMKRGVIPIGVGGGPFDEHRKGGRKKGDSATKLVADYLGVTGKPELVNLLRYTSEMDGEANAQPFSLGSIIKDVNFVTVRFSVDILAKINLVNS